MGESVVSRFTDHAGVVDRRVVSDVTLSVNRLSSHLELPTHRHTAGALGLILNGEITEAFGSSAFSCTPGAVLLRPAEAPHSDRVAEGGASLFVIEPSQARVDDIREHGAFLDAPEMLARDRVSDLAAQLYYESRRPDTASPLCIQALMFEIAACLIRRSEATSADGPKWLGRVRSRIDDTYWEKLCISELAREAGVHSVHLARTFREIYGVTVGSICVDGVLSLRPGRFETVMRRSSASRSTPGLRRKPISARFFAGSWVARLANIGGRPAKIRENRSDFERLKFSN
jgi:AraC family transcriptional regulator